MTTIKKKNKLRVIDQMRVARNINGCMRRITREIESGTLGNVTDVVILIRSLNPPNGCRSVELKHFGISTVESVHWMLSTAKNRIEPS